MYNPTSTSVAGAAMANSFNLSHSLPTRLSMYVCQQGLLVRLICRPQQITKYRTLPPVARTVPIARRQPIVPVSRSESLNVSCGCHTLYLSVII